MTANARSPSVVRRVTGTSRADEDDDRRRRREVTSATGREEGRDRRAEPILWFPPPYWNLRWPMLGRVLNIDQ